MQVGPVTDVPLRCG